MSHSAVARHATPGALAALVVLLGAGGYLRARRGAGAPPG